MMESESVITQQPLVDEERKINDENLPSSLKRLSKAKDVTVKQLIDPVEVLCCCFARPSRYSVYMEKDTAHTLYIQEDCYARQIMGAARGLTLKFTDTDNIDAIKVIRPQTCSRGCCGVCCVLPSLEVQSPPGTPIAVIRERRSCCRPIYEISNPDDEVMFTLHAACTYNKVVNLFLTDIEIDITDENGEVAAKLMKSTKKNANEYIGAVNNFTVKYLLDLPVLQKAGILGSMFLVDYHYFERENRFCC